MASSVKDVALVELRLPALPEPQHRHFCQSGDCTNYYVCSQRDGCDHDTWTCPSCEMAERDAETERLMERER